MSEQEKNDTKRKEWSAPQLTVLVRNNSEEAVLATCKTDNIIGSSFKSNNECWDTFDQVCTACNLRGGS